MTLMKSLRRSKSPRRGSEHDYSSAALLSPIASESSNSSFTIGNDDFELDTAPPTQSSQLEKLKKVFSRSPKYVETNDTASISTNSLATSIRGEEVFRIAIDEDSMYDDSSVPYSPRWKRAVGAVEKPPSVQKLDALLGDSYSESDDEGYSSRRSTVRTSVDDDMNLDDSTHPIPSLAPPRISDLSTISSKMCKSTKSLDTATTMQTSDHSFLSGKPRTSFVSRSDSYSQYSASNSAKSFLKNGSNRGSLGPKEESFSSRASTIRSAVEQSLEESTHDLPPPGPLQQYLQRNGHQDHPPSIAEVANSSSSSRMRSDVDTSLNGDDSTLALLTTEPPTLLSQQQLEDASFEESSDVSSQARSTASSRKGRKSRSPRPTMQARGTSSRSKSRKSPSKTRSASRVRSSRSPHQFTSDAATLQQIIGPGFNSSSPSVRGERKVLEGTSERGQRFTVRRSVSSPVQTRKQLLPSQEERSERMRRSITESSFGTEMSRSPSGRQRRSVLLENSVNDEVSERRGVSPLRGSLLNRSLDSANPKYSISERGIRSIDTRDFPGIRVSELVERTTAVRSNSPGLRFQNSSRQTRTLPIDKRKSHSTRAERSISIDMESDEENPKGRGKKPRAKDPVVKRVKGKVKSSPTDKRKSHSTRAERTVPFDVESDTEASPKGESKTFHGRQTFSFETESGDESLNMDDQMIPQERAAPFKGSQLKRRGSDGGIASPVSDRVTRSIGRRNSTGLRMDMTGLSPTPSERGKRTIGRRNSTGLPMDITGISPTSRSRSPSTRLFGNSLRHTRSLPIDKRKSHSTRAERSVPIYMEYDEENEKVKASRDATTDSGEKNSLGTRVKDKIKSLKDKSISLRGRRSIDMELGEEKPKLKTTSSRRERRSIDVELDLANPKQKNLSSRRERRSIDVAIDEERPLLKSKSSRRERRSIDVTLDEEKPKQNNMSSRREGRSIDIELNEPKLKGKSSRREKRSIDMELDEDKPNLKSKSSRRQRRSIDVESGNGKGKKSKSSRLERRTLSVDLDFGSDHRQKKTKSSRRTVSVDSGDSCDLESKPPKGKRSLTTESLEDATEASARKARSRSRKKESTKKASKSPKGKAPSIIDNDGNETSSTIADIGDISVDVPAKSRPSSPSTLLKKLKSIRSERSPKKDVGRSLSPKRSPTQSSKNRKLRLSIS